MERSYVEEHNRIRITWENRQPTLMDHECDEERCGSCGECVECSDKPGYAHLGGKCMEGVQVLDPDENEGDGGLESCHCGGVIIPPAWDDTTKHEWEWYCDRCNLVYTKC